NWAVAALARMAISANRKAPPAAVTVDFSVSGRRGKQELYRERHLRTRPPPARISRGTWHPPRCPSLCLSAQLRSDAYTLDRCRKRLPWLLCHAEGLGTQGSRDWLAEAAPTLKVGPAETTDYAYRGASQHHVHTPASNP